MFKFIKSLITKKETEPPVDLYKVAYKKIDHLIRFNSIVLFEDPWQFNHIPIIRDEKGNDIGYAKYCAYECPVSDLDDQSVYLISAGINSTNYMFRVYTEVEFKNGGYTYDATYDLLIEDLISLHLNKDMPVKIRVAFIKAIRSIPEVEDYYKDLKSKEEL